MSEFDNVIKLLCGLDYDQKRLVWEFLEVLIENEEKVRKEADRVISIDKYGIWNVVPDSLF